MPRPDIDSFDTEIYKEIADLILHEDPNEVMRAFPLDSSEIGVLKVIGDRDDIAEILLKGEEKVVRRFRRPALFIQDNTFSGFNDQSYRSAEMWKSFLDENREAINIAILGVGRIEDRFDKGYGSAVLIRDDVLLTNEHVARDLVRRVVDNAGDASWEWRVHPKNQKPMKFRIDFRQEHERVDEIDFELTEILFVSETDVDIALFRCETTLNDDRVQPVTLAEDVSKDTKIGVIGYPSEDEAYTDTIEIDAERIFEGVYNVKRIAPGEISRFDQGKIFHDCSTLPGNSGSAVINLETGALVGLHYYGDIDDNIALDIELIRTTIDPYIISQDDLLT